MSDSNLSPDPSLNKAIDDVLSELDSMSADSEEYASATDQLVKLHKLKMEENNSNLEHVVKTHEMELNSRPKPLSRDTLVLAGANLLGIVLIVGHERANVMTSKAIGFVKTLR